MEINCVWDGFSFSSFVWKLCPWYGYLQFNTSCVEFNVLIMIKFISHATEFYVLVLNKHCSGYNRVTLYFLALGNLNGDKLFENIMILHLKYLT